jgi:hypothetical protein
MDKETTIEKLPEKVKGRYGIYCLVKRNDSVAIYGKEILDKKRECYEVFIIRKVDAKKTAEGIKKWLGIEYDLSSLPDIKERYPNDEDFGKTAWTYPNLESASQRFNVLSDFIKNKLEEKSHEQS